MPPHPVCENPCRRRSRAILCKSARLAKKCARTRALVGNALAGVAKTGGSYESCSNRVIRNGTACFHTNLQPSKGIPGPTAGDALRNGPRQPAGRRRCRCSETRRDASSLSQSTIWGSRSQGRSVRGTKPISAIVVTDSPVALATARSNSVCVIAFSSF